MLQRLVSFVMICLRLIRRALRPVRRFVWPPLKSVAFFEFPPSRHFAPVDGVYEVTEEGRMPYHPETFRRRRAKGDKLFTLVRSVRTSRGRRMRVSFAWLRYGRVQDISEVGRSYDPGTEVTYIYDCITLESFRGRGFYPTLIRELARRETGRVLIYCDVRNSRSKSGIEHAKFERTLTLHSFFGISWQRRYRRKPESVPQHGKAAEVVMNA
jgi:hypothetical protein